LILVAAINTKAERLTVRSIFSKKGKAALEGGNLDRALAELDHAGAEVG
jgi:hypothetical protein